MADASVSPAHSSSSSPLSSVEPLRQARPEVATHRTAAEEEPSQGTWPAPKHRREGQGVAAQPSNPGESSQVPSGFCFAHFDMESRIIHGSWTVVR